MFNHCDLCNSPVPDELLEKHQKWHASLPVIKDQTISVFWTNEDERKSAYMLRDFLRGKAINVSGHIIDENPRFDIFTNENEIDSVLTMIAKRLGTCRTSISD